MAIRISRPKGALRFALRLPVHLYHWGFGALLDHRFMLLTHQGRKSGHLFETVLEVVLYERATDATYVISGWGDKTDWYRNIRAHPALRVQVGMQTYVPDQQFLDPHEVVRVWTQFRHKHPIEERMALRLYSQPGMKYKSDQERRDAILGSVRMVSFRPR